jgi:hypothetical protein
VNNHNQEIYNYQRKVLLVTKSTMNLCYDFLNVSAGLGQLPASSQPGTAVAAPTHTTNQTQPAQLQQPVAVVSGIHNI